MASPKNSAAAGPAGRGPEREPAVLVVDPDPQIRKLLQFHLRRTGCRVLHAESGEQALEVTRQARRVDLALLDLRLPGMGALETLRGLSQSGKVGSIIAMAHPGGSLADAIAAMREGAYDVVSKTTNFDEVHLSIRNALQNQGLVQEVEHLRAQLREIERPFSEVIGGSAAMAQALKLARKVRDSNIGVLLQGESGTGKEVIARAIHFEGSFRDQPFVALNCAAIPESLLESELFGHEKGAFTGATQRRAGKFAEAHDGTLFLDEIGELSAALQAKLLRVLQTKEVQPIGGQAVRVNVRIIAATNQDLMAMVQAGQFRLDLYYRLAVFPIVLPALRERREDIPLLIRHFLEKFTRQEEKGPFTVTPEAIASMVAHDWPGNVRELENTVYRAVVLAESSELGLADFSLFSLPPTAAARPQAEAPRPEAPRPAEPPAATAPADTVPPAAPPAGASQANAPPVTMAEAERQAIARALESTGGNMSRAAIQLGIGRATLYRKLRRYGSGVAPG
jgi:DNA-binding NtrC family response regulator